MQDNMNINHARVGSALSQSVVILLFITVGVRFFIKTSTDFWGVCSF